MIFLFVVLVLVGNLILSTMLIFLVFVIIFVISLILPLLLLLVITEAMQWGSSILEEATGPPSARNRRWSSSLEIPVDL